jgi:hypothetical protein
VSGSEDGRPGTLDAKLGAGFGWRLATWARASVVDRLWRG